MGNPLKLNEKVPAFSYMPADLFDVITRIVAHPHTVTTQHDKTRAMAIFLTFADYLGNYTESDNNGGHYIYESDYTDFEGHVLELLGKFSTEFYKVNVDEILK